MTRLELVASLQGEVGQPLQILPWWQEAFVALDDPTKRELILWLPRQTGKSQCLAAMAHTELLTRPGSYTIFVSASENQAAAIYHRKIRRPLERLLKTMKAKAGTVTFTKRLIEVKDTGSAMEIVAPNEATIPGRSPTLFIVDEARDVPDDVYTALAPSVIGAGGKIVLSSTAGPPRGFFYELIQHPMPETWLYHSNVNDNPHANQGMLGFLKRRLALFAPAAARRELENEFTEDGESFLPAALIDVAVDDSLGEIPSSPLPASAFLDLSRKRDLTSLVTVLRDKPRRPEAPDHLIVASVQIWNPRQSPTGETDFADVRATLAGLPARFPGLHTVLVDEGAEAGTVLPWAKTHPQMTLLIRGFVASVESNITLWGALAARLHARTLSIPRHERLIAELRGLRQESFAFGSKWRIVDSSRKLHRDVSLALAGACFAAGQTALCTFCNAPGCSGFHLWGGGVLPELPPQEGDAASRIERRRAELQAETGESLLSAPEEQVARHGYYWPGGD